MSLPRNMDDGSSSGMLRSDEDCLQAADLFWEEQLLSPGPSPHAGAGGPSAAGTGLGGLRPGVASLEAAGMMTGAGGGRRFTPPSSSSVFMGASSYTPYFATTNFALNPALQPAPAPAPGGHPHPPQHPHHHQHPMGSSPFHLSLPMSGGAAQAPMPTQAYSLMVSDSMGKGPGVGAVGGQRGPVGSDADASAMAATAEAAMGAAAAAAAMGAAGSMGGAGPTGGIAMKAEDYEQLQRERKLLRNREAVRRCRKRKQLRVAELEDLLAEMELKVHCLRKFIESKGFKVDEEVLRGMMTESGDTYDEHVKQLREKRLGLLRMMIDSVNSGGVEELLEKADIIWHSDFVLVQGMFGTEIRGVDEVKAYWEKNGELIPDLTIVQCDLSPRTPDAERVRLDWSVSGTFAFPESLIRPLVQEDNVAGAVIKALLPLMKNKRVTISGFSHMHFRGCKLEHVVHSWDHSDLLAQFLGMQTNSIVDNLARFINSGLNVEGKAISYKLMQSVGNTGAGGGGAGRAGMGVPRAGVAKMEPENAHAPDSANANANTTTTNNKNNENANTNSIASRDGVRE